MSILVEDPNKIFLSSSKSILIDYDILFISTKLFFVSIQNVSCRIEDDYINRKKKKEDKKLDENKCR